MYAWPIGGQLVLDSREHAPDGTVPAPVAHRAPLGLGIAQVLAAWLFGRLVVTAHSPVGALSFRAQDWYHWDAFNYLAIATSGRTLGVCGTPGFPAFIKGTHWCGLAGWLPGFPLTVKAAGLTGVPLIDASTALPSVFLAAALFVAWFGWLRHSPPWRSAAVLLLIAVFPGAVYNVAPFPTSLALLGILVAALAAAHDRRVLLVVGLAVAVVSYSTAVFAAVGLLVGIVVSSWGGGVRPVVRNALWGAAGFVSLVVLAVHDQLTFHHWNAYSLVQDSSRQSFALPGVQTFDLIVRRTTRTQIFIGHTGAWLLSIQAALAIALVVAACTVGLRRWWRCGRSRLDLYPATIGAVALVCMMSSGTGSIWHRGVMLVAPAVLAFRHLPAWVTALLVVATAVVTALVSSYFFANTLG